VDQVLDVLRKVGERRGKSVPSVALNYCLCKGALPLVGIRQAQQAQDAVETLGWRLTKEDVVEIEQQG
jgi:aryl-alcohol dehydrogenase-like predicted oxidoreductase